MLHEPAAADVQRIVQSVVTQYGLSMSVGRVLASDRAWQIELRDRFGGDTVIAVQGSTPQHVRRAVIGALDVE